MAVRITFQSVVLDGTEVAVALSPTDLRWNDFGYNFHALARIYDPDGRDPLMMRAFVIPFGDDGRPVNNFSIWYENRTQNPHVRRSEAAGSFDATVFNFMFAEEASYTRLLEWCLDESEYVDILDSLNDITLLMTQGDAARHIATTTISSEQFRLGVVRTGAAYRAYRRGYAAALRGGVEFSDSRVPFTFGTHLDGFRDEHNLSITYQDHALVSDRIHCILGVNGAGKSRFLSSFVQYLASAAEDSLVRYIDGALEAEVPRFSRVLAYSTEQGSPIPKPESFDVDDAFDYQHVSLTSPIEHSLRQGGSLPSMARMLVDLVRESELAPEEGGLNRYELFRSSVHKHIDMDLISLPIRPNVPDGLVFRDAEGGSWVQFSALRRLPEQRKLEITGALDTEREIKFFDEHDREVRISSGQRVFLRFSLHFLSFSTRGMLVIMDEPETHLHPNLVSSFSLLLNEVLEKTSSVALVATHYVYMAREVPTHCNHILVVDDGIPSFNHVYMRTLGASPTTLSMAVFGDESAKAYHKRAARLIAERGLTLQEVIESYGDILSPDMLIRVRMLMSDSAQA